MKKTKKTNQINKTKDLIRESINLKGESKYISDMIIDKNNKEK